MSKNKHFWEQTQITREREPNGDNMDYTILARSVINTSSKPVRSK